MSNKALTWAFESGLPAGQRFVLVVLADKGTDHSGEDWTCFPSVSYLVETTGMGRSTIERHLTWLWREGWISREPRVRADGTLGINDFTLHRLPETRARLRAERAEIERLPGRRRSPKPDGRPSLKSRVGPSLKSAVSIPQIGGQATLDLRGHEPLSDPLTEPSSASEPGDEGFDEVVTLWPLKGRKFTRMPAARAAWALRVQAHGVDRMRACVKACAEDPDRIKGKHGWPGLDVFLRDEIYLAYLPAEAAQPCARRTDFAALDELREAIAQAAGEHGATFARYFLDRCQIEGTCARAATPFVFDKLAAHAGVFLIFGLDLVGPTAAEGVSA